MVCINQNIYINIAIFALLIVAQCSVQAETQLDHLMPRGDQCQDPTFNHPTWTEAEKWTWHQICIGEVANLFKFNLEFNKNETQHALLSPTFLETILLYEPWKSAITNKGVRIIGAHFNEDINLTGAQIKHELWLDNSVFDGRVNFSSAEIYHSLSLEKSLFRKLLSMQSITVGEDLFMRNSTFESVLLSGAEIGGQMLIEHSVCKDKLNLESITIGEDLFMRGSTFESVSLSSARIEGYLLMDEATFNGGLTMRSIMIGIDLFMEKNTFKQHVVLTAAKIKSVFSLVEAQWQSTDKSALLTLTDAEVGSVRSHSDTWPTKIELDGFTYRRVKHIYVQDKLATPWHTAKWLKKTNYTPQSYIQLAQVLRNMGHEVEADDILFESKEFARNKACTSSEYLECIGQFFLRWGIGYGIGTNLVIYPFMIMLILISLSILLLWIKREGIHLVKETPFSEPIQINWKFYLFYSLEMLPFIHLRERYYDEVNLRGWILGWFYFSQLFGYLLVFFVIAGLTGLTE